MVSNRSDLVGNLNSDLARTSGAVIKLIAVSLFGDMYGVFSEQR